MIDESNSDARPSKSQRKKDMDELQTLRNSY